MDAPVTSDLVLIAHWNKSAMEIAPAPNKPSGSETKPEPKPEQKPGALPSTGDATIVLGVFAALPGIAALAGGALLRKKR